VEEEEIRFFGAGPFTKAIFFEVL